MEMFCRKCIYSQSPPAADVTVKRCASCPETYRPVVTLHGRREERRLLDGLLRHKKVGKHVSSGKWKSHDDITFRPMTSQHLGDLDHMEGSDLAGSKVYNNPLYQPPASKMARFIHNVEPPTQENTNHVSAESAPNTSCHRQTQERNGNEAPSHTVPDVQEPSFIARLMKKDSGRWKRKKSKFVHTQPLYQDYCVYYTNGGPGLSPAVFSLDVSLSFAGLFSSSLLGVHPGDVSPQHYTSSLWQELPEVKLKGIAETISPQQKQLQEAIFEVVTSEASYQRSLSVVIGHFQKSRKLSECLFISDQRTLFSNLPSVRAVSESFLLDLEEGLERDIFLSNIGERVLRHCPEFHRVYIPYVTNQMYQERLMQQLVRDNGKFLQVLRKLEEQPVCKRQLLKSFLVLPFQRITRLKILLENILRLVQSESELESSVRSAVSAVGQIVSQCNEGVRGMMQTEELILLEKQMDFQNTKSVPLVSRGRVLIRHGELVRIGFQDLGIGHRPHLNSKPIYLHLLSDLLLLSCRADTGRFLVTDYAVRGQVKADHVKAKALGLPSLVFLLRLRQNDSGLSCEIVLQAPSESEKENWISQITKQMSQEEGC
ncbi:rho guanine nucleotide exchange factor 19-like [Pseudophryne corroboree]|uniref:rho guanine nucleotide exchange factor 19-like n=1 Tax=Pseudophryne corroboree TaxID=495146 RepID=UPI0030817FCC